jgi:hypothetical protein
MCVERYSALLERADVAQVCEGQDNEDGSLSLHLIHVKVKLSLYLTN